MNFTNALLVLILAALETGWYSGLLSLVGAAMLILVPLLAMDKSLRFYNRNNNNKTS